VEFTDLVSDPWFQATTYAGTLEQKNSTLNLYWADEVASPLACSTQWEFCDDGVTDGASCTGLNSLTDSLEALSDLELPDESRDLWFLTMITRLGVFQLESMVQLLGNEILQARESLATVESISTYQQALPGDQWKREVQWWFRIRLASLQEAFVSVASGLNVVGGDSLAQHPATAAQKDICKNQKVISPNHITFKFFYLMLLAFSGLLIVGASFAIKPFSRFLRSRNSCVEWESNATLQLQRLAYEQNEGSIWDRGNPDVPVPSDYKTNFKTLVISNPTDSN
jgi:hypothetical protein